MPALPGGLAVARGIIQMRISRLLRLNRRPGSTATNRRPRAYVFIRETGEQLRRGERRCAASIESEASRPARYGGALVAEDHVFPHPNIPVRLLALSDYLISGL